MKLSTKEKFQTIENLLTRKTKIMKSQTLLLTLLITLLMVSCRKDIDLAGETTTTTTPPIIENYTPVIKSINSSVDGQVQDENKQAIVNATVRLGNLSTLTDEYGLFSFKNVSMNEKGTFITVTQDGYLDGSRRFFPRAEMDHKIVIEMMQENFQFSFAGSDGGNVPINGTTSVDFSTNSIVNANGEVYTGEVFTAHAYLDPTAATTADRMPGNLQGVQTDLEEVALQSFGMINLSLQDDNGAPLKIRQGFTATIKVAIPASIAANAPTEIPLWSFDEELGIWIEEGFATKVNGHYVGEVSHFSWWNCDAPFPVIEIDITLTDENLNPVAGHIVAIGFGEDSLATNYSYTNNDGFTSGKVPAGEILLLQIRGLCGELIYTTNIGPFTENTSLGSLAIEDSNLNSTEITGSLVDCNGNPVLDGGVIVKTGDKNYHRDVDNGNFNFFISTCEGIDDLTLTGLDFNALVESDPVDLMVETSINTGPIEVCDNPITESNMTVTIDSQTYVYFGEELFAVDFEFLGIVLGYLPTIASGVDAKINIVALGLTAGNYDDNNEIPEMYDLSADVPYNLSAIDTSQAFSFSTFNLTETSPNVKGNFSGTALNTIGTVTDTVSVTGSFNIFQ